MIAWTIHAAAEYAPLLGTLLTESNAQGEDGIGWLLLAGPAAAIALYTALFRYYRNTDKSHSFERETVIESKPVSGADLKVDEIRGTKHSAIVGNNVRKYRERVQRIP